MIDLYFAPTPNGWKITIMLEECGLPYNLIPMDLHTGDQLTEQYKLLNPNGRIPTIIDRSVANNPITVFESGAILVYLAEKTGRFIPRDSHGHYEVLQWVFWQMANLGPMAGQLSHFFNYARQGNGYAYRRYRDEYHRLLGVLNQRLDGRKFIAGDFSIADIACWPWLLPYRHLGFDLDKFPHLGDWHQRMKGRPAVSRGANVGRDSDLFFRMLQAYSNAESENKCLPVG